MNTATENHCLMERSSCTGQSYIINSENENYFQMEPHYKFSNTNVDNIYQEDFKWTTNADICKKPLSPIEKLLDADLKSNYLNNHEDFIKPEHFNSQINYYDQQNPDTQISNFEISSKLHSPKKSYMYDETISLIRDSISGAYESEDSFPLNNERISENEQAVPNQEEINENLNILQTLNQNDSKNTFLPSLCSLSLEQSSERQNIINQEVDKKDNIEKAVTSFDIQEVYAFTPSGQFHRLLIEINHIPERKVTYDPNITEMAAIINISKKIMQIQNGLFIPEGVDYIQEEMFNNWLNGEIEKIEEAFKEFEIGLDESYLKIERKMLILDRNIKQYSTTTSSYVIEVLDLVGESEVHLDNIVHVPQIYDTIHKIAGECIEEGLCVKAKQLLKKFQSLLLPPKGIKVENNVNDALKKGDERKMKSKIISTSLIEFILHLIII